MRGGYGLVLLVKRLNSFGIIWLEKKNYDFVRQFYHIHVSSCSAVWRNAMISDCWIWSGDTLHCWAILEFFLGLHVHGGKDALSVKKQTTCSLLFTQLYDNGSSNGINFASGWRMIFMWNNFIYLKHRNTFIRNRLILW